MIILCIIPLPSGDHLRRQVDLVPLFLSLLQDSSGSFLLLIIVKEYRRPVLRSHVWSLAIHRCRVVHLEKEFQKFLVGDFGRVIQNLECFGVFCNVNAGGRNRTSVGTYGQFSRYRRNGMLDGQCPHLCIRPEHLAGLCQYIVCGRNAQHPRSSFPPTLVSIKVPAGAEAYIYPAANVAFSVVSGRDMPPPIGPKGKLLVEKRRKKREARDGSMNVVARVRRMRRTAAVKIASLSV